MILTFSTSGMCLANVRGYGFCSSCTFANFTEYFMLSRNGRRICFAFRTYDQYDTRIIGTCDSIISYVWWTMMKPSMSVAWVRLRSHRHDSGSGFAFTGCLSLYKLHRTSGAFAVTFVQARNLTRVYWQSPVKSNRVNALRKSNNIQLHRW